MRLLCIDKRQSNLKRYVCLLYGSINKIRFFDKGSFEMEEKGLHSDVLTDEETHYTA